MAKTSQQLIRESVRRILKEAVGEALSKKLFGTKDARTDLYNTTVEKWSDTQEGKFKFVFTPTADKSKIGVVVSAEEGADERAAMELQSAADEAVKTLVPADWVDVGTSYTYIIPAGVSYKKEEEMELKERWLRHAGLLK